MQALILTYKNLILQISLSLSISLFLHFFSLSALFLRGLNTYIHPDDVNPNKSQSKVAIRRPSDHNPGQGLNGYQSLSSNTKSELKNRKKSKEEFEFNEENAQIFRLKLGDSQLFSRLFFDSYRSCFNSFLGGFACFVLHCYLNEGNGSGVLITGSIVPVLIGVLGVFRVLISLIRVSLERSAFRRSERELGFLVGVLGFLVGLLICLGIFRRVLDFEFKEVDGYGSFFVAVLSGCIAGFLYMATSKFTRSFWLGTDQIRCNLSIIQCGWFAQTILYSSYLVTVFASLLWIKPFAEILVIKNNNGVKTTVGHREKLVGNVGMTESEFAKLRFWCLFVSGLLQFSSLRPNVQTYLNEAVLSWYQRLHASVVPELEYSRAKVFLHNHYLGVAALQFFSPAALILFFLGFSRVDDRLIENFPLVCGLLPCSAFIKEIAFLMAWWVAFVWSVFTSAHLALYRRGILYVS